MGYPVQTGAPEFVVGGRTYAVGAFNWPNPMQPMFVIGVFVNDTAQGWLQAGSASQELMYQITPGALLAAVQAKGGIVAYCDWLKAQLNGWLAQIFATVPAPVGEPTTEAQAEVAVAAAVNAFKVTVVNGVPVIG